mmetsp:Transcript_75775/g.245314  ORF Transcript_75775/g.245314 Transcript_75775/m.245314 type:complete len:117 (+) Transcript_75775:1-351(+)
MDCTIQATSGCHAPQAGLDESLEFFRTALDGDCLELSLPPPTMPLLNPRLRLRSDEVLLERGRPALSSPWPTSSDESGDQSQATALPGHSLLLVQAVHDSFSSSCGFDGTSCGARS